jgi:NADH-quinone oxidoreductase subunit F
MTTRACPCGAHAAAEMIDVQPVDRLVAEIGGTPDKTIPLLQAIQKHYAYLPLAALERVAATTSIPATALAGVSSFYTHFRLKPAGKHHIRVCTGTACHVKGAPRILDAVRRLLNLAAGEDTDAAREFTVEGVACLGCCTLAPVMLIDGITYGHLTPEGVAQAVQDFLKREAARGATPRPRGAQVASTATERPEIRIGQGSCCIASGAGDLRVAVEEAIAEAGLDVAVKRVGCVGMCHRTPLLEIVRPGQRSHLYAKVTAEEARQIIRRHFRPPSLAARLREAGTDVIERLLTDRTWPPVERYAIDIRDRPIAEFLGPQKHIALEHCGELEPTDLDDYLRHDGFRAARECLTQCTPEAVIETITRSGLRGRGGGGFTTGRKWGLVRAAPGDRKIIVLNGDEGDPGAFMDRMLLESYPYRVIEGMLIAAYAVGAHEGILYIREEYPLAVKRMREAIAICVQRGHLGPDVLGTGFGLDLRIMEGAGAFVCGEETALIASIEGKRGMPRLRPPFPAQSGLWGLPTLVNNVETYANVPWLCRAGPEAFAAHGTRASAGTKVFALAGRVARGGLIEVPMGISINRIVNDIGGGVADGRIFKAVQVGGPSGGCIPARLGDTPVDFEALRELGAIMGSGGLVVLDDRDCMVDMARYFLTFTQDQSCGRCVPCRVGTRRMLDILDRLCQGQGKAGDVERLETLARMIQRSSLCALGQTAPNPVLSTIRYFREEYEAHIEGRCPARKCTALIVYRVTDRCIGCTRCAQICPVQAIVPTPYKQHQIDAKLCVRCGMCRTNCPAKAIEVGSGDT